MRTKLLLAAVISVISMQLHAFNYKNVEIPKMEVPEMKAELVYSDEDSYLAADLNTVETSTTELNEVSPNTEMGTNKWKPDFDFFKQKTNPGTKPYKFMDDMTFVGVPLFFAGLAVKGDKAMFRVNNKEGKKNTQLLTNFKTGIDDYSQFFGPAMVVGLKLGGVEGRSSWPRLLASAGMSYGLMALLVNSIKYTAKEMRPDGTSANSWPSGHTATAFVGATLLHKEYGLTRSPWYSVAGYGVATATGVMRVLNNRHWISDIMSGAGIGILSGELGYALCDLMFKGKGILRNDLQMDFDNPSFFSISMGVGLGSKDIDFTSNDIVDKDYYPSSVLEILSSKEQIKFRAATVVDAEGAYFFNKYIGIGGRFRVRAMSAKSFGDYTNAVYFEDYEAWGRMAELSYQFNTDPSYTSLEQYTNHYFEKLCYLTDSEEMFYANAPVTHIEGIVKSDHMTEFTGSVGLYFNLPLSKHFALGAKALIGRSITQELDIDAHAEGNVKDIDYDIVYSNGEIVDGNVGLPTNTGAYFIDEWDYLTLGANNSTSYGTGISLTYKYKSNFSWRIFIDYDYTEKTYTLKYDPFHFLSSNLTPSAYGLAILHPHIASLSSPVETKKSKKMNYFTLGLSFVVNL